VPVFQAKNLSNFLNKDLADKLGIEPIAEHKLSLKTEKKVKFDENQITEVAEPDEISTGSRHRSAASADSENFDMEADECLVE